MAAGDLITTDWEMEYNGLLLGGTTDYSISQIDGLLDIPALTSGDQVLLRRHGLHPGDDFLQGRAVTVTLEIYASSDSAFETAMDNLLDAVVPGGAEIPLVFQVPGVAGGSKSLIYARPRRRSLGVNWSYYHRVPTMTIEFEATDPRVYSASESSDSVAVATTSGGLTFNATPDFSFGVAGTGGTIQATNSGNFATGAVFTVNGPCTNPRIENLTSGKTIEIDITLATGSYLTVDTEARTVLLNGTASRYSSLTSTSEWFDLDPGTNEVKYRATTATGSTLDAAWRSAWV